MYEYMLDNSSEQEENFSLIECMYFMLCCWYIDN